MSKREQIAAANDAFRKSLKGGTVLFSREAYDLPPQIRGRLLWAIGKYDKFDPNGYHDAGVLIFADYAVEWSIEKRKTGLVMLIDIASDLQWSA
jgi:hypothetical protein